MRDFMQVTTTTTTIIYKKTLLDTAALFPFPGRPAVNLNGVMATLSGRGGEEISFYPPYYSSPYAPRRPYYWTTTAPWTTPYLSRGENIHRIQKEKE